MRRFLDFLTYNNIVPISLGILFLGAGGVLAATPTVQQAVFSTQETVRSVDNTKLLATDLATYNVALRIDSIVGDDTNYYIDYSYKTLAISDYVWRDTPIAKRMTVSKRSMLGRDLGLYITEQIGQVVDQEIAYLKQVQATEQTKGVSQKVVVVEYSGIVGQMFDTKEKTFPDYVPIITPPPQSIAATQALEAASAAQAVPQEQVMSVSYAAPPESVEKPLSHNEIQAMIQAALAQFIASQQQASTTLSDSPASEQDSSSVPEQVSAPAPAPAPAPEQIAPPAQDAANSASPPPKAATSEITQVQPPAQTATTTQGDLTTPAAHTASTDASTASSTASTP